MKHDDDDIYADWIASKKEIGLPDDFADRVMGEISAPREQMSFTWAHVGVWAKVALITFIFVGGFGRYAIFLCCLLFL